MITKEYAAKFADEWIAAWNAHDLGQILSHYADDFEMTTPFIVKLAAVPSGTLKGKDAVGSYWKKALDKIPDLHFELIDVFTSVDSVCLFYKSVLGLLAVEWFHFDRAGKVSRAIAHYSELPK
ncbi:MAG: nuclear transport factor 2 family protein [Bdellovibrionota bacterium]